MPPEEILTFFIPAWWDFPARGGRSSAGRDRSITGGDRFTRRPLSRVLLVDDPLLSSSAGIVHWLFHGTVGRTLVMALGKYTLSTASCSTMRRACLLPRA